MRDDEIRARLRQRNPWWRTASAGDPLAWIAADETLREAAQHDIGYRPAVLDDVEAGGLYVLRGPRRVGKSVAVKRLIQYWLEGDVSPGRVIYLALNDFSTQDFRRALAIGRSLTASVGDGALYWVFDEITAVSDWTRVLKDARDETPLRRDAVVLTGSSAHDLEAARRNLGAGRVGNVRDPFRLLLPMSFREVIAARRPDLPLPPRLPPDQLQSAVARAAVEALDPFTEDLDLAWQAYLEHGGFPRAVAEQARDGDVSHAFCRDIASWLAPDVTPEEQPESVLRLLGHVGRRMTSPLDVKNTGDALGIGRTAMATRINRLRNTIAAFQCPQIDDAGSAVPGSQSKLYLIDPLVVRLPELLETGIPVADMSQRCESALGLVLARSVDRYHPGRLLEGHAIGYARTGGPNEIDFAPVPITVAGETTVTTPVESKWVARNWRSASRAVEGRYGRGVVATKNINDLSHSAWGASAPIVALLLG